MWHRIFIMSMIFLPFSKITSFRNFMKMGDLLTDFKPLSINDGSIKMEKNDEKRQIVKKKNTEQKYFTLNQYYRPHNFAILVLIRWVCYLRRMA